MKKYFNQTRKLCAISIAAALLTSCSVETKDISLKEREKRAVEDLQTVFHKHGPEVQKITLWEALAIGLKYNLDTKIKEDELALAGKKVDLTSYSMLPTVDADGGWKYRTKQPGTNNISISSRKQSFDANLTATWNLLDTGIGYVSAQQETDEVRIVNERRRRVIHGIATDIRHSFWRAMIAEQYAERARAILNLANKALARSERSESEQLMNPLESLNYQRKLLSNIKRLQEMLQQLETAKIELAALLNFRSPNEFELVDREHTLYMIPEVSSDVQEFEMYALTHRPEIKEEDYRYRIQDKEITKAWMNLIPKVSPSISLNHDNNPFLFHNYWIEYGLRVAVDVLGPLTQPERIKEAELGRDVIKSKRDALTVAILTQVHIAYLQHEQALDHVKILNTTSNVDRRIYEQSILQLESQAMTDQDVIQSAVESLFADMSRDLGFVDMHDRFSRLMTSVGFDLVPSYIPFESIEQCAEVIRDRILSISTGNPTYLGTVERG